MPRLTVWFTGAALSTGAYFTYQHYIHTSNYTKRYNAEVVISAEKFKLQSVMQRYAALLIKEQTLQARAEKNSSGGITNTEKLLLYCELQELRELFWALPLRLQTAAEKLAILKRLDAFEQKHCTVLNFRDVALTVWEVINCQVCFGLYLLCFCLIDPLVQKLFKYDCVERARRAGLHAVSHWISQRLCIPANMTFEEGEEEEVLASMYNNNNNNNNCSNSSNNNNDIVVSNTTTNTSNNNASQYKHKKEDVLLYLVFSPQHWMELVGFWACPTNPLLFNTRVQLLLTSSSFCTVMPFEEYWQSRQKRLQSDLTKESIEKETVFYNSNNNNNNNNDNIKSTSQYELGLKEDSLMLRSSFGYPLALCITEEGKHILATNSDDNNNNNNNNSSNSDNNTNGNNTITIPRLLPVVSTGLPRILYIDDTVAHRDVRGKQQLPTLYTHLQERQYPMRQRISSSTSLLSNSSSDVLMRSKQDSVINTKLYEWHQRSGIPLWNRVVWGSVYGGVGRGGNYDKRALMFHVGHRCYSDKLIDTQLKTQEQLLHVMEKDLE